jgi:uncharacterized membrane protein YgcG
MSRFAAFLGSMLGIVALFLLLRVGHPDIAAESRETSWAPEGIRGLATAKGVTALSCAVASAMLFIIALRPKPRTTPATFFDEAERQAIVAAIAAAEDRTSGEIRVHLEDRTVGDVLDCARRVFQELGMTQTAARNGALLYLSVEDHRFAIVGDEGIDRVVPPQFWEDIRNEMAERFAAGEFQKGIVEAIDRIGEKLHQFFPAGRADRNELPDAISIEEEEE